MPSFLVHIKHHCGWHQATASGDTFGEAAISAVIETCKQFRLDVNSVPHSVQFKEREDYASVVFTETSRRQVFRAVTYPGDLWFSHRVRQGHAEDCPKCGGTGINFYNPFTQCWACGDHMLAGKGTGKREAAEATA